MHVMGWMYDIDGILPEKKKGSVLTKDNHNRSIILLKSRERERERESQVCVNACLPAYPPSQSTPSLKPGGRAQDRNRLVHDPFADAEVVLDPSLDVFVIGELVRVQTGAVNGSHYGSLLASLHTHAYHAMPCMRCRQAGKQAVRTGENGTVHVSGFVFFFITLFL